MKTFNLSTQDLGRICSRLMTASAKGSNAFDIIRRLKPDEMSDDDWSTSDLAMTLMHIVLEVGANNCDSMPGVLSMELPLSDIVDRDGVIFRVALEKGDDGLWCVSEHDGGGRWAPFVTPIPDRTDAFQSYSLAVHEWHRRTRGNMGWE